MPAAAVIPAPIAYIKVAAVKKLVVGFVTLGVWPASLRLGECRILAYVIFLGSRSYTHQGYLWTSTLKLLL